MTPTTLTVEQVLIDALHPHPADPRHAAHPLSGQGSTAPVVGDPGFDRR